MTPVPSRGRIDQGNRLLAAETIGFVGLHLVARTGATGGFDPAGQRSAVKPQMTTGVALERQATAHPIVQLPICDT